MKNTHLATMILSVFLLTALMASPAQGQNYIHLDFEESAGTYTLSVIGNNLFYKDLFFRGVMPESDDYRISLYDYQGNLLYEDRVYLGENNFYPFQPAISRITINDNDNSLIISDRQVSFCNYNSICEPCHIPDCTLIENSLTCADCPSGAIDYICDLANDGVCDPDCSGKDADCPGCEPDCWYKDSMIISTTCANDKGGISCTPGQLCTGEYVYADDTGSLCCTGGQCMDREVYVEPDKTMPGTTPSAPEKPDQMPEEIKDSEGKSPPLWLIPLIAIIAIILLAYFLLRKPEPDR